MAQQFTVFGNRARLADIPTPDLREQVLAIVEEMADRLPETHADRILLEAMIPQLRTSETFLRENAQILINAAKRGGVIPHYWYTTS